MSANAISENLPTVSALFGRKISSVNQTINLYRFYRDYVLSHPRHMQMRLAWQVC